MQTSFRHLINIQDLSRQQIIKILDIAKQFFIPESNRIVQSDLLANKTIANVFFEASTRTRSTFELAAKKLSANVLNLDIGFSAISKGESLRDTIRNLAAMQCDILILRHPESGAAKFISEQVDEKVSVINAGDGCFQHPTQALLDMFTIRKHLGSFKNLNVAIIGDVKHSRVARSQIQALQILGAKEIRVIGPKTLLPENPDNLGVKAYYDLTQGLKDINVIIMLRLQKERQEKGLIPSNSAYYRMYGLTDETLALAANNPLVIHPGPINRGIEIQSEIADGPNAVILDQVTNGIAVRMAVMASLEQGC